MRRQILAAAALLATTVLPAGAADLIVSGDRANLTGSIGPGDGYGFKQRLDQIEAQGTKLRIIALNTPGGSIDAAKIIGQTIRAAGISTDIEPGGMCASACVLIFLSGKERVFHATGRLGVHQSSNSLTHAYSADGTRDEVEWADKFRAPAGVTTGMRTTDPSGITWLTDDQVKAIGVRFVDGTAETTTPLPYVAYVEHRTTDEAIRRDQEITDMRRILHR